MGGNGWLFAIWGINVQTTTLWPRLLHEGVWPNLHRGDQNTFCYAHAFTVCKLHILRYAPCLERRPIFFRLLLCSHHSRLLMATQGSVLCNGNAILNTYIEFRMTPANWACYLANLLRIVRAVNAIGIMRGTSQ